MSFYIGFAKDGNLQFRNNPYFANEKYVRKFINNTSLPAPMPFSKSFPKQSKTSAYPQWEEVFLTEEEEKSVEQHSREENIKLFKECMEDAKNIMKEKGLKDYQSDLINIATALFEKRASHTIYWKESKAKDKFDNMFNK